MHSSTLSSRANWQSLKLFALYRLSLAFALVCLYALELAPAVLKSHDPHYFIITIMVYFVVAILATILIAFQKPNFSIQIHSNIVIDLILLAWIMHTAGGITTGLGMLMIVVILYASLFLPVKTALLTALTAFGTLITEQLWSGFTQIPPHPHYLQAFLLGLVFLASCWGAVTLSKKLHLTQAISHMMQEAITTLEQLNEHILNAMHDGVMAVDEAHTVHVMNPAACQLLNIHPSLPINLSSLSEPLHAALEQHLNEPSSQPIHFNVNTTNLELVAEFVKLQEGEALHIIFLRDALEHKKELQNLKQASLARLASSIAHEIKNPLSAVTHGAGLLLESAKTSDEDKRLSEIILQHAKRANEIIVNVQNLSTGKESQRQMIPLREYLEDFIKTLPTIDNQMPAINIEVPDNIAVKFDPSQLGQILTNLCENGLYYSFKKTNQATLCLRSHQDENHQVSLDIIDQGPGVDKDVEDYIFEPFYTTKAHGSGVGLYVAKELSAANRAQLDYISKEEGGTFRLTFAV